MSGYWPNVAIYTMILEYHYDGSYIIFTAISLPGLSERHLLTDSWLLCAHCTDDCLHLFCGQLSQGNLIHVVTS